METKTDDAKLETTSSESQTDDTVDSSTTTQPAEGDKTLLDVVLETAKQSEDSPTSEEGEKSPVLKSDSTEEEKKDTVEGKTEDAQTEDKTEEPPPFHEHPRWQEMVSQRDQAVAEVSQLKEWKTQNEEIVKSHNSVAEYCTKNNISPNEFQQALEFIALSKTDPVKALGMLRPLYEGLQAYQGENAIPPELQQEIEIGQLTEPRAREIMRWRSQSKFNEELGKRTAAQEQERRQQEFVSETKKSLMSWEQDRQVKDPDFKPKESEQSNDGKYEWFVAKFQQMLGATPPKTPNDVVSLAEKAYQSVAKSFTGILTPTKKNGHKVLSSTRSSALAPKEPETIREAAQQAAARHGITF